MTSSISPVKRSAVGIIFSPENKVLFIKRRDVSIWALPGGGVEPNETPEAAIIREFFEETGLTVKIERQVALYTPINRLTNDSYVFECSIISGNLTTGEETQDIGFFALDHLPDPLFFLHLQWIEDAQLQVPYVIHKPLSQITYFNLFKYFLWHPVQVFRIIFSRCGTPFNT